MADAPRTEDRTTRLLREALTWAVDWLDAWDSECMPEWREWQERARAALASCQPPESEVKP